MRGRQEFKILLSPREVTCRICRNPIEKGKKRLTANLGSGHFSKHFHVKCFVKKYKSELDILLGIPKVFNPSKRSKE